MLFLYLFEKSVNKLRPAFLGQFYLCKFRHNCEI